MITGNGAPNGRAMFKALDKYYLGVGAFAMEMTAAEKTLDTIFYNSECKPHMWWAEFKRQLTMAYATIDRTEGRQVYSEAFVEAIIVFRNAVNGKHPPSMTDN